MQSLSLFMKHFGTLNCERQDDTPLVTMPLSLVKRLMNDCLYGAAFPVSPADRTKRGFACTTSLDYRSVNNV